MKRCTRCREEKPIDQFHRNRSRGDGWSVWCKACVSQRNATPEHRARWRRNKLASRFGITAERYAEMLSEQEGVCASCGRAETVNGNHGSVKALAVDHDHETGDVRGLLCQACNLALGVLGDDPARLMGLAAYVVKARDNTDSARVPPLIGP